MAAALSLARRRLLRDLAEVQREPSGLVSALPLDSNIFEWHANLRPSSGPLEGVTLHVRIVFPGNYPDAPPNMIFPMDKLPSFVHPNLYSFGLCLDILSSFIGSEDKRAGWSPAYGVRTLLLQLQSFLFEFDAAPQDHGGHYSGRQYYGAARIARVRREAAKFTCGCGHCSRRPWPPLAPLQTAPASSIPAAMPQAAAEVMPQTAAAEALSSARQARSEAEAALRLATELRRRTAGGLGTGGLPVQLLGAAGTASLAVRVTKVASSGYVRLGFGTSSGSKFVGWDSRGSLTVSQKAQKVAMPRVGAGDVMEIAALGGAVHFSLNGQEIDAAVPHGPFLWEVRKLAAEEGSPPRLLFQQASIEVLAGDEAVAAQAEVRRLEAKERELEEQLRAEEAQRRALRLAEEEAMEAERRAEARAAEELRAAEAWARVLAPPRAATQTRYTRKQQWLRHELADLAKPLHEGSASSPWSLMRPPLLMNAFMGVEACDVPPLARTCRVWRRLSIRSSLMERVQLRCFYTKASADEDVLGFGVRATYHDDGNLKSVSTELDALSAKAFYKHHLRRGVWGDEFTHFLPLVLNAEHGRRAMPDLERTLAVLACREEADSRLREREFEPWMAMAVIPQLMNSFVVSLMKEGESDKDGVVPRHASERALLGYCSFHHMLLALCKEHPSIVQVGNRKLREFVAGERTKAKVPDLGQLIVYLSVSDAVSWQSVAAAVMDECHVRGALWLLRSQPKLGRDVSDKVLLAGALQGRLTSARLLMFQAYFLRSLARPTGESLGQSLDRYNRQFGLPTAPQQEMLVQATGDILAVRSWPDVYRRLGLSASAPDVLAQELREAMNRSAELGYHNPAVLGPFGRFASFRRGGGPSQEDRVGVQRSLQQAFGPASQATQQGLEPSRPRRALTSLEEAEAKKIEKVLREIARLERRLANGEKLDALQLRKLGRKKELEGSAVMQKLHTGFARGP